MRVAVVLLTFSPAIAGLLFLIPVSHRAPRKTPTAAIGRARQPLRRLELLLKYKSVGRRPFVGDRLQIAQAAVAL